MPIFEYSCGHCNYTFDKLVVNRDAEVNCPLCQGQVKKLMSTFSLGISSNSAGNLPTSAERKMCTGCG